MRLGMDEDDGVLEIVGKADGVIVGATVGCSDVVGDVDGEKLVGASVGASGPLKSTNESVTTAIITSASTMPPPTIHHRLRRMNVSALASTSTGSSTA
mmetsp:Transcript_32380/g.49236  ORF Transcript_32380/g.49236 Transcript_32380/m.49236 type:complete len:98 (-) Transcript_32380:346-639(-)